MKRTNYLLSLAAILLTACTTGRQPEADLSATWKALEKPLNFYIANDLGRNGYYEQKTVAATMGSMAESVDIEFVVAAGDVHHFEGVRSTSDPLWMTNYELIYSHPDLMVPWYPICGNHEYRGNTDAGPHDSLVSGVRKPRVPRQHRRRGGIFQRKRPLADARKILQLHGRGGRHHDTPRDD